MCVNLTRWARNDETAMKLQIIIIKQFSPKPDQKNFAAPFETLLFNTYPYLLLSSGAWDLPETSPSPHVDADGKAL